jgi:CheY-like chemotaxis protein
MKSETSILIADSQREQLFRLEHLLSGEQYTVHDASNAHEVLDFLEGGARIDLVLMSADLAIMDGFETCRRIKANPLTARIPVVIRIAEDRDDYRDAGIPAGVDAFISAQWSPALLLETLDKFLGPATAKAAESRSEQRTFRSRESFGSFGYSEHDEVSLLLPWYLNGSLEQHEIARIDRHLADCAACGSELRELTEVATAIAADTDEDLEDDLAARASFARLRPSLRTKTYSAPTKVVRSGRLWRQTRARGGLAAFALAASVMLLLTPTLLQHGPQPGDGDYVTLANSKSANAGEQLQIVFAPELAQTQRDALLAAVGGRLVGESNSAGAHKVRLERADTPAGTASVVAFLRQQPGVLLVEPVDQPIR